MDDGAERDAREYVTPIGVQITDDELFKANLLVPPGLIHLTGEEGWHMFFDKENHVWVRLNESGKEIIESLRSHPDLAASIEEIARRFNLSPSDIQGKVLEFVRTMIDARIVHVDRYVIQKQAEKLAADHPYTVYFSNTERCNLTCPYCYNADSRSRHSKLKEEMTTDESKRALKMLKDFGVMNVAFCGGEPMCRPDILEIASYAKSIGLYTAIVTNGTLITDKVAPKVAELFDLVWVSLDSAVKEEHEAMRGKGSYQRTMRALRLLTKYRPQKFIVNSVVTKLNVYSMPETHRIMVDEFHVDLHRMSAYMETAGITYDKNGRPIEGITNDPSYHDVFYSAGLKLELGGDELPPIEVFKEDGVIVKKGLRRIQCGFASGDIHMVSNGDIYPCVMLYEEGFKCGNIMEEDIAKIYRESEVMNRCREATIDKIEECEGCFVKYICAGGCRASAYHKYGSLTAYPRDLCGVLKQSAVDSMWYDTRIPLEKMKRAAMAYKEKLAEIQKSTNAQVPVTVDEAGGSKQ